jgi:hypothetical protein
MKNIKITPYLNEIVDGAVEKFIVREYNDSGNVVRTRVVTTLTEAENVKLEWQKQS